MSENVKRRLILGLAFIVLWEMISVPSAPFPAILLDWAIFQLVDCLRGLLLPCIEYTYLKENVAFREMGVHHIQVHYGLNIILFPLQILRPESKIESNGDMEGIMVCFSCKNKTKWVARQIAPSATCICQVA